MKKSNHHGFTLIELLVVIAIIGLITTLAVMSLNSARAKSRDTKRVSDIKRIQTGMALYFADHNAYPAAPAAGSTAPCNVAGQLGCAGTNGVKLCNGGFKDVAGACTTVYMPIIPLAPFPADGSCTDAQNIYTYSTPATFATYSIGFCLGRAVGDIGAGIGIASQNGIQ